MKTRKINKKVDVVLSFCFFFCMFYLYGQTTVNNIDCDYRIKKYKKEIIEYLVKDNQFGTEISREIKVSDYVGRIGIVKIMEIFPVVPEKNSILLVRFFSLSSHANNYWGILESNSKCLFYFNKTNNYEVDNYLQRYNLKTQKIILNYIKIFNEWDHPEAKENIIIDEIKD